MKIPHNIPWLDFYRICGQGGGGTIWIARDPGRIFRAVKIIPSGMSAEKEQQAVANYRTHIPRHKHLIDIFFSGKTGDTFYYVMELADNVSSVPGEYIPDTLAYRLKQGRLPQEKTLSLMLKITEAAAVLHKNGFAHRDLKPENILFVQGELKIGDPDLLCSLDHYSYSGTPEYSPQLPCPAEKQDLYALGKLLYCMFTGESPDAFPVLPENLPQGDFKLLNRIAMRCCDTAHPYNNIRELQKDLRTAEKKMLHHKHSHQQKMYHSLRQFLRRLIPA